MTIQPVITVYKPVGMTPFQLIQEFKKRNREYRNESISHAGKLDPLAEGLMILVVGKEINKIKKYMGLDKQYIARILFGFSTDSQDIQGIPVRDEKITIDEGELKLQVEKLKGDYLQEIPVYSGKMVKGRPLYYYARKGKLDEIEIPKETVKIYKIKIKAIEKIGTSHLLKEITWKLGLLDGDFRQEEIKEKWKEILECKKEEYVVLEVMIDCSSGTYIRAIADDLGKRLGTSAVLLNLVRTKVSGYSAREALRLR